MFFVNCVLILSTLGIQRVASYETILPPNLPILGQWLEGINNQHLTKMTGEIFRDTVQKMKIVRSNAEYYKSNPMYTIGTIASNIYAMFARMVTVYKEVSDLYTTRHRDYDYTVALNDSLSGFGMCQSIYHQIRLERKLFDEVMQRFAIESKMKLDAYAKQWGSIPQSASRGPQLVKGGMLVARRFNVERSFDDADFDSNFELPLLSTLKKQRKNSRLMRGSNITQKIPKAPSHAYAPPPLSKQDQKKINLPALKEMYPTGKSQPSNPNVRKLMTQLNKDNPELNPDLDAYLREHRSKSRATRGRSRTRSDSYDAYQEPRFGVQSRRMGSDNNSVVQQPRSDADTNVIQQPRPETDSFALQPRKQSDRFDRYRPVQQAEVKSGHSTVRPRKRTKSQSTTQPKLAKLETKRYPGRASGYADYYAPMDGRGSFYSQRRRGGRNRRSSTKKPLWKPKIT